MAQLITIDVLEVNDVERVETSLFNVRLIREDTISDEVGGCEFYIGSTKYLADTTAATLKALLLNYDANVVIPLQVVSINGVAIGGEIHLSVDKIEIGYVDGVNTKLITRNYGFLQTWVVSDTMNELVTLSNVMTTGGGSMTLENLTITGTLTVEGTLDVTGKATLSDDLEVAGDVVIDGDTEANSLTTVEDIVVGGDLGVAGESTFADEVVADKSVTVTENVVAAQVLSPVFDTPTAVAMTLAETATSVTANPVGFVSDTTAVSTWVKPGEETLTEGTGQAITALYMTYLEAGDSGASTGTLEDGTVVGQLKKIWMTSTGGGTWEVTFSTIYTITFTDQGEWILLRWNGVIWTTLDTGICDGAPVVGVA